MKLILTIFLLLQCISGFSQAHNWTAKRISAVHCQNEPNSWYNFRTDFNLESLPGKALTQIACDSKYWLWINGELVVFEGQLKRGPAPNDTYYDEVDIASFLKKGKNTVAVLLWFFGKDGFSHHNSGQAGLVFECNAIKLQSNSGWFARVDSAFQQTDEPNPNYRLSESNVKYDARKGNFNWINTDAKLSNFSKAVEIGAAEAPPWNKLVKRPIPLWKNNGIRAYENADEIPTEGTGEWIVCKLPYNCQVTPVLDVEAPAGTTIKIQTDNFDLIGLHVASVRAEYVTREGRQQYESPGWMNGHVVKYFVPKGVKINALEYRETGFDCDFTGHFKCSDQFYNELWKKSFRTLYVTMRDTYMDCPDRERAQWWGDEVNESGEAFYALSPQAAALNRKGILELVAWQRDDSILYSPVPQGNWTNQLPGQMLASVGYYGFWNYYINTGDIETIRKVYGGVKKYLSVWKLKPDGTLVEREGNLGGLGRKNW